MRPLDHLRSALADRYTVDRELGEGGMATVYLASDRKLVSIMTVEAGVEEDQIARLQAGRD